MGYDQMSLKNLAASLRYGDNIAGLQATNNSKHGALPHGKYLGAMENTKPDNTNYMKVLFFSSDKRY